MSSRGGAAGALPIWLAACALVAATSTSLARAEGPWLLGLGAIAAAQAVLLAGRRADLPVAARWAAGLACLAAGALAYGGDDRLVYLGSGALMLVVVDRLAGFLAGISAFVLAGGTGMRSPPDPIARDFARVRRERAPLTVASIAAAQPRGSTRRLAGVASALTPHLRVADTVVRVAADGLLVVLPGADDPLARAVLERLPTHQRAGLLIGTATFPQDGHSYALLKEVARSRRRPWPSGPGPGASNGRPDREAIPARLDGQPAVLFETRGPGPTIRRTVDLLVLAVIAPVVCPLVALLAIAVRLDSPGPAFVRIQRLGRDGRPFALLKLRSMRRDADRMKEQLRHLNTMAWPDFKIAEDPRVTRLGRLLRKYSLDELPQLYNVLRGEMTLVGPRPCSVKLADYELWQSERLDVTPGLVGRWQAEGRGRMDFTDRCRLDIDQVRSRSVGLNIRWFLATVRSVFDSRGAY